MTQRQWSEDVIHVPYRSEPYNADGRGGRVDCKWLLRVGQRQRPTGFPNLRLLIPFDTSTFARRNPYPYR